MTKKLFFILILFVSSSYAQEIQPDLEQIIRDNPELVQSVSKNNADNADNEDGSDKSIDNNENEEELYLESDIFGFDYINSIPKSISTTSDLPVPNNYNISLGDSLKIILTGGEKDIFDIKVGMDGNIFLPNIGSINVFGDSISDVRKKITQLVELSYVGTDVSVSISSLSAKKINIIGAVKNPGSYIVSPFSTITSSLAYSGGFEDYASLRNITVLRKGVEIKFDLYDFLIFGNRNSDINIEQGDTILINSTNNFVEISGSVNRPKIYEYKKNDKYSDLLSFALGLAKNGDEKNITVTVNFEGKKITKIVDKEDLIDESNIEALYVGNFVTIDSKDVFVSGSVVTSGFYSATNESLGKFLENLRFSSDIYPFYAIYETETASGLIRSRTAFSLADPDSYSELRASSNTKIYFLSREEALNYSDEKLLMELEENERKAFTIEEKNEARKRLLQLPVNNERVQGEYSQLIELNLIDPDDIVSIAMPNQSFRIPVKGKVSPQQLHSFLSVSSEIDLENVAVITTESSSSNSYNQVFDSSNLVAISFPPVRQNLIEVSITGEVRNPGTFIVSSSTKLTELYILSGGFLPNSFQDGISLFREDVKEKQIKALREAKAILTDSLVQKSTSVSERGVIDIEAVLELADLVEPTGRVAGDFSENSDITNEFILKDGDIIIVPAVSVEVTVQGEVLNSSSFIFNADMDYNDYIQASGGYTSFADKRAAFIIRANGESTPVGNNIFSGQADIYPGDTIVIPRDLDQLEALPLISMATKIISDIAFSAASLNAIQD